MKKCDKCGGEIDFRLSKRENWYPVDAGTSTPHWLSCEKRRTQSLEELANERNEKAARRRKVAALHRELDEGFYRAIANDY